MDTITPQRIVLSRKKGFDLQKFSLALNGLPAVNCARPSAWGNPFSVLPHIKPGARVGDGLGYVAVPTVEDAIACFRKWIAERPDYREALQIHLRGKNLACWCKTSPCHCDVLLKLANA